MIKKVTKAGRAQALEYLYAFPAVAMPIYDGIKQYGLDSENFTLWGDFWVDMEIKCLFAKIGDVIYIYSNSPAIETMDVYTFLRDNHIPYEYVAGDAVKIRGYRRHILFKQNVPYKNMVLSKKNFTVPQFSRQKAQPIDSESAGEVLEFLTSNGDFTYHGITLEEMLKCSQKYGGYFVRSRGKIACAGFASAGIRKLLYISVLKTADIYKENYGYTEMVVSQIAAHAFEAGVSGICTDNVSAGYEKALTKLGFEPSNENVILKR